MWLSRKEWETLRSLLTEEADLEARLKEVRSAIDGSRHAVCNNLWDATVVVHEGVGTPVSMAEVDPEAWAEWCVRVEKGTALHFQHHLIAKTRGYEFRVQLG